MFDKLNGKSFRTNIENVAVEGAFHDLPPEILKPGTDVQIAEKVLADLESDFLKTTEGLLQTVERNGLIDSSQKEVMAFFIALQYLRTLSFRRTFKDMKDAMATAVDEKLKRLKISEEAIDAGMERYGLRLPDEEVPATHVSLMLDQETVTKIAEVLEGHIWLLGVDDTEKALYTSDNPVAQQSRLKNQFSVDEHNPPHLP